VRQATRSRPTAGSWSGAAELADFLRTRRGSLSPEDVGLPPGQRRRTRGLRREEVALLASISATYYTYLEQAREVRPSREVLDSLARALRLDAAERVHLHELVHRTPPPRDGQAALTTALAPGLAALVDRLDPFPTYVKDHRWEVLGANRAARALFGNWSAAPGRPRHMLLWMLLDPAAREVYPEWRHEAAAMVARFRMAMARRPSDAATVALVERLRDESPEFAGWWERHDVLTQGSGRKRLFHPTIGEVCFEHVVLRVAEELEQTLVTFSPQAGERPPLQALAAACP
jgi:transcriptional regulator with XRE-family HTH domain